jgi:hypothetical protein
LSDALAFHGVTQAVCEGCPDGQIGGAYLWLHSADRNISDDELDRALSESVILRLVWDPFMLSGIQPRPETEIVPVSLSGLTGRARVFGIKNREGGMQHVIALSVAKDCLSLDGILFAKDGVAIAIDRWTGSFGPSAWNEIRRISAQASVLLSRQTNFHSAMPFGDVILTSHKDWSAS